MYADIKATALISLLCATTLGAPASMLQKRIAPNTQSCTASDRGDLLAAYGVNIGVTYAGGSGCDNVYNALQQYDGTITNWQCVDDGSGDTQLYFNSLTGLGSKINQALAQEYPQVNGFNCPDY